MIKYIGGKNHDRACTVNGVPGPEKKKKKEATDMHKKGCLWPGLQEEWPKQNLPMPKAGFGEPIEGETSTDGKKTKETL